jgi:hypothetical protein
MVEARLVEKRTFLHWEVERNTIDECLPLKLGLRRSSSSPILLIDSCCDKASVTYDDESSTTAGSPRLSHRSWSDLSEHLWSDQISSTDEEYFSSSLATNRELMMEMYETDDENSFQQEPRKPKQALVPGASSAHQAAQVATFPHGQLIPPQAACNFPTVPIAVGEAVKLQARAAELRTEAAQLLVQALECEAVSGKIARGAVQSRWEAHAAELRTKAAQIQAQAEQYDVSNSNV